MDEKPVDTGAGNGNLVQKKRGPKQVPRLCIAATDKGPCKARAIEGQHYCMRHSKSRPRHTLGTYSQWLTGVIAKVYADSRQTPAELISQYEEIALLKGRIAECVSRLKTGESSSAWDTARNEFSRLKVAVARGNREAAAAAMSELERVLLNGVGREAVWQDIYEAIRERRLTTESEASIALRTGEMMSRAEVRAVLARLFAVIAEEVTDRLQLTRIGNRMHEIATLAEIHCIENRTMEEEVN